MRSPSRLDTAAVRVPAARPASGGRPTSRPTGGSRLLAALLFLLAAGVTALSVLGPLVLGRLTYHVVADVENQVVGGDAAALGLVVPLLVLAGVLVLRGHRAGPVLALGPTAFAMYVYPQLAIGGELATVAGTSERFFPLFLLVFLLAAAGLVTAWRTAVVAALPELGGALRRAVWSALLLVAAFLVLGMHLRGIIDAVGGPPYGVDYTQSPTVFWLVKWMDLGVVVPVSVVTAVGVYRRAPWVGLLVHAVISWCALLGTAVACMGAVMLVNGDPAGSVAMTGAVAAFAAVFLALTLLLVKPLLTKD